MKSNSQCYALYENQKKQKIYFSRKDKRLEKKKKSNVGTDEISRLSHMHN